MNGETSRAPALKATENTLSTAEQFRQYARESLTSADQAKTEAERQAFLAMARAWTQAAMQLGGTQPSGPLQPQRIGD